MGPVIVESERLRLREWMPEDAGAFRLVAQDPEVVRYITDGRPLTDAEIAEFIARQRSTQAERGWCRWALEVIEPEPVAGQVVGFCGPGCTFAPDIEVGWWLRRDLWGRGLATEAAVAAVRYCFEVIGFDRLTANIRADNGPSLAVAHRVGFAPHDEIEYRGICLMRHVQHNPLTDPPRDPRYRRDCTGAPTGSIIGDEPPPRTMACRTADP